MKLRIALLVFVLCLAVPDILHARQQQAPVRYIAIETPYGSMVVKLFNETPVHRDNFLKLVNDGYLNRFDMNRVVKNFVIQGGETDSAYAAQEKEKGPNAFNRMAPELFPELFHKKGVLAAGRDDNPQKTSFPGQYYFVQGRKYTDEELNRIELRKGNGFKFSKTEREVYTSLGGTPNLDQDYTVFGEVVKGMEVIDTICAVPVNKNDRPLKRIDVKFRVLRETEVKDLLK